MLVIKEAAQARSRRIPRLETANRKVTEELKVLAGAGDWPVIGQGSSSSVLCGGSIWWGVGGEKSRFQVLTGSVGAVGSAQ